MRSTTRGTTEVQVEVDKTRALTEVLVADEGEGIFVKIQRAFDLHHPREAILELAKGKLTTAPEQHSGEGIFFTSRAVDFFEIESYSLRFSRARCTSTTRLSTTRRICPARAFACASPMTARVS